MFSPNQLYDYLRYYCFTEEKNISLLHFQENGTKKLQQLSIANSVYINKSEDINIHTPHTFRETSGCLSMFDQEPIDINTYYEHSYAELAIEDPSDFRLSLRHDDFVFAKSIGIYNPIIGISEINSNDVIKFENNFHIPMHFWSNAITSRYWFAMYEPLKKHHSNTPKRFGVYIRDTTGSTRAYRKQLLEFVKTKIPKIYCPLIDSNVVIPSTYSAVVEWPDHNKFDIQLVPETVFDTEKVHLTEKVFKPIVMHQAFILLSGPNSLQYLKNYGFKTFSGIWDESYDTETNSSIRFQKIIKVIESILLLDEHNYRKLINKTKKIIEHNRLHFYSEAFKMQLMNELHTNLENALNIREEQFYTMPGGLLFHEHNKYFNLTNKLPTSKTFNVSRTRALSYAYKKSKSVGDAIVKKYNHLI